MALQLYSRCQLYVTIFPLEQKCIRMQSGCVMYSILFAHFSFFFYHSFSIIGPSSFACDISLIYMANNVHHQIYNTIYPFAMAITVNRFFSPDVFMCFGLNIRLICFMNKNFTLCLRLYQCCVNFIFPAGLFFSSFNS